MTKHRLIATLLVNNGNVVQTRKFKRTNMVGSAFTAVDFFNGWTVDEIVVLEISNSLSFTSRFIDIVHNLSRRCFVPLTVGGKIVDLEIVRIYTRAGADKVVINTGAVQNPNLITEVAENFGSQCAVVSIDGMRNPAMQSGYEVYIDNGRKPTGLDLLTWARKATELGAGELMVNSVEFDGDKRGYDLDLVRQVSGAVNVPVIAMGGVGRWQDLVDGIKQGNADAVSAGNIFHYTEHSTKKAKEFMADAGVSVRYSAFYKINMPRRPAYEPYLHHNSNL
ncbi:MAG: imidazole glycerol phosphate synthase cyclase subunit [Proteobacteria bacterium]|nr:imidazole glycerol phosphate synthase cyclase subunit [Pseudomonadota bacterium]MBU1738780.1 imidazole glycerol phosphate synthase cyclase subunit [Pseudomonadota bacterium]